MKSAAEPPEAGESSSRDAISGPELSRGISILNLILRIIAGIGTFASAMAMGTTNETISIVPQFAQVTAEYDDLPTFTFFVIANSIVCGYLVLSLPFSIFHIIRTTAKNTRIISVIFDTVMLALITAGASSAAAIVYLAHKGNASANWMSFCQQFDSFCERITGSMIGSFGAAVVFILIIITSAVALSRR